MSITMSVRFYPWQHLFVSRGFLWTDVINALPGSFPNGELSSKLYGSCRWSVNPSSGPREIMLRFFAAAFR